MKSFQLMGDWYRYWHCVGIVNEGELLAYSEVETELCKVAEELILNSNPEVTEKLLDFTCG